jgi:hypothetical protein
MGFNGFISKELNRKYYINRKKNPMEAIEDFGRKMK